ncbi:MAG: radical SAM protein [Spirochaetia bacterium]|nr:radical SAM protein [Spirochaetia bacterium]
MTVTDVSIIQPPLVQLNTPYPSGAYLRAFFSQLKKDYPQWAIGSVRWIDYSNALYRSIFSQAGLKKLFSSTEKKAMEKAFHYEKTGKENEAFNLRRYVSQQEQWIRWIPAITDILSGKGRELSHEFVRSPGVPRGYRMENYLAGLSSEPDADDALILASLALADLADYISVVYDSAFELIRYGESAAVSATSMEEIKAAMAAPIMNDFYTPLVQELIAGCDSRRRQLICVSCPFPGTVTAALLTCKLFKEAGMDKVFTVMGGGCVNTDLRDCKESLLAEWVDAFSFDRGYGSYWDFFRHIELLECSQCGTERVPLGIYKTNLEVYKDTARESPGTVLFPQAIKNTDIYKMRFFSKNIEGQNSKLFSKNTSSETVKKTDRGDDVESSFSQGGLQEKRLRNQDESRYDQCIAVEDKYTVQLVPDFSDIDFSLYPRLADSKNPMHRLWSDGAWLKVYLAHGCYWHQCAFCDTSLDYVACYHPVEVEKLHEALYKQAEKTGVRGIHLVDEAAPPVALRNFALANLKKDKPLSFWGNIRYEKVFSRDLADILAHGGLTAVSGGIEIASGSGLDAVHKGTDLDSIVAACAAFKEAGILTHAYMIYGYWLETPQMLIDSMETLRQLFAAGLLDSSFWHKFTLTRHSRIYTEYCKGMHQELEVTDNPLHKDCDREQSSAGSVSTGLVSAGSALNESISAGSISAESTPNGSVSAGQRSDSLFSDSTLHFKGEEKSVRYGKALNNALATWMAGEKLKAPVTSWFDFPMPKPSVSLHLVEHAIARYEKKRDTAFLDYGKFAAALGKGYVWLGGKPMVIPSVDKKGAFDLCWSYMGELIYGSFPFETTKNQAEKITDELLAMKSPETFGGVQQENLKLYKSLYTALRGKGLSSISIGY